MQAPCLVPFSAALCQIKVRLGKRLQRPCVNVSCIGHGAHTSSAQIQHLIPINKSTSLLMWPPSTKANGNSRLPDEVLNTTQEVC